MAPITPAATPDMATAASKLEKKLKKEKKRAREEDGADGERKHKKSKSTTDATLEAEAVNGDGEEKKKKKKDKKSKHSAVEPEDGVPATDEVKAEKKKHKKKHRDTTDEANTEEPNTEENASSKKKHKKNREAGAESDVDKAERKKKKKSKQPPEDEAALKTEPTKSEDAQDPDAMDVDEPVFAKPSKPARSKIHQPPDIPANPQFPFFTQTVSLYEAIYPVGWDQPVTNSQYQHLKHLQNRYVPSLRGVLLDYKNVTLGERPGRAGAAATDDEPTTLLSRREAAVGFGWITADVDLFVPTRGAWMEGSVNLQTEGHIGVVCFGKFNASIEARRLPPSWKWVQTESTPGDGQSSVGFDETASLITADDHGVVRQVHSTGYWADAAGEKVRGRIRFRIRNFDVGTSGETSYLSLEGTMLDRAGEKTLVAEEARAAKSRRESKGGMRRERKRAPEFSMTRFEDEAEAAAEPQDTEAGKLEEWNNAQTEEAQEEEAKAQAEEAIVTGEVVEESD